MIPTIAVDVTQSFVAVGAAGLAAVMLALVALVVVAIRGRVTRRPPATAPDSTEAVNEAVAHDADAAA
jgi:hypothetical protein